MIPAAQSTSRDSYAHVFQNSAFPPARNHLAGGASVFSHRANGEAEEGSFPADELLLEGSRFDDSKGLASVANVPLLPRGVLFNSPPAAMDSVAGVALSTGTRWKASEEEVSPVRFE